jgi:hypothetical protein
METKIEVYRSAKDNTVIMTDASSVHIIDVQFNGHIAVIRDDFLSVFIMNPKQIKRIVKRNGDDGLIIGGVAKPDDIIIWEEK